MKRRSVFGSHVLVALVVCFHLPISPVCGQSSQASKPNVVLIITDDLGWADLGSYGSPDIDTPNIDALAADGVRLTDFYANGVFCSPTRAGLISGSYQQRYGVERPYSNAGREGNAGLVATGHSLPQLLRDGGYVTGLVGKWHLGYVPEKSPAAHGFDYFFGMKSGYHDYYTHLSRDGILDLWENDQPIERRGYTTDLITEYAVGFIERNAEGPFFVDVAYNAPHWPYQVPDEPSVSRNSAAHLMPSDSATSTRADYRRMVERLDRGVGEIVGALDRLGLTENTIVIFTNDNGGEWLSNSSPLFSRKWTVWEGGIRVPAIIRWPGRIPAASVSDQVGITMDLSMSVLAAAGVDIPAGARYDGMNLFPILSGDRPQVERTLYWRTAYGGLTQKAVRRGDMKLVIDGPHQFVFNLRTDPSERNDLAAIRQADARELYQAILAWEREIEATAVPDH